MEDKRKNNGGARKGAGRPSKADEQLVRKLGIDAIVDVYGSVEDYYKHIAKESKDSFPHLKLLQEYVFGKPKEIVEIIPPEEDLDKEDVTALAKLLKDRY